MKRWTRWEDESGEGNNLRGTDNYSDALRHQVGDLREGATSWWEIISHGSKLRPPSPTTHLDQPHRLGLGSSHHVELLLPARAAAGPDAPPPQPLQARPTRP